jgi:hypothetical protein
LQLERQARRARHSSLAPMAQREVADSLEDADKQKRIFFLLF